MRKMWIAGTVTLVLFGFVVVCVLIEREREEDRAASRPSAAFVVADRRSEAVLPTEPRVSAEVAPPRPSYVEIELRAGAQADEIRALSTIGARLVQMTGPSRAIYEVSPAVLARVSAAAAVASVRTVAPETKVAAVLRDGLAPVDDEGFVWAEIYYLDGVAAAEAEALVAARGLEMIEHVADVRLVRVRGALAAIRAVAEDDRVFQVWPDSGEPREANTTNAQVSNIDQIVAGGVTGYNLSGQGVTLAQWDSGRVRATHQDLLNITNVTASAFTDHSTHVAGTMTASGVNNANALGMAPNAQLRAYQMGAAAFGQFTTQAANYQAANNSWGFRTGWDFNAGNWTWWGAIANAEDGNFGKYTANCNLADAATQGDTLLIIVSAGNDRNDGGAGAGGNHLHPGSAVVRNDNHPGDGAQGGWDTLSPWSSSKNPIVVGAVDGNLNMAGFSNWGPADDGRVKPDLMARGVNTFSTLALNAAGNASNTTYGNMSGTSMAAPTVTGSVALLIQHLRARGYGNAYVPPLSLTKGLLVHTATDLGNAGPDYSFGWGLLDARTAADFIVADANLGRWQRMKYQTLNSGQVLRASMTVTAGQPILVTLAWSDPAAPGNVAATDNAAAALINDLDIVVVGPNGSVARPWILNPAQPGNAATTGDNTRDNVEQVFVAAAPVGGTYHVYLRAKNALAAPQPFAILSSHAFAANFAVAPALATPQMLQPVDWSTTTCAWPMLTWNPVAYASGVANYRVQLYRWSDFAMTTWTPGPSAGSVQPHLTQFGWYSWEIRSENPFQNSTWSSLRFFQYVSAPLEAPTALSPSNQTVYFPLGVQLSWQHPRSCDPAIQFEATLYRKVQVGLWINGKFVPFGWLWLTVATTTTHSTSWSVNLPSEGDYSWSVRATLNGETGPWASAQFTHAMAAMTEQPYYDFGW